MKNLKVGQTIDFENVQIFVTGISIWQGQPFVEFLRSGSENHDGKGEVHYNVICRWVQNALDKGELVRVDRKLITKIGD